MEIKKLFTKGMVEEIEEDGVKTKLFVASDEVEDRQGEVIMQDGWELDSFKQNPVIQWAHNPSEPTIGRAEKIGFKNINGKKKLVYEPKFHRKTPMSNYIADLVEEGYIKASSVGFKPLEQDENKYTKAELLEISFVNVPANQNALSLGLTKGYSAKVIKEVMPDVEISEKPYPNEHACRIRQPGEFEPDSFRRTSRDHEGKKYNIIMGKLKGETTMTEQAYRYPKDSWTADEAKSHCSAHDGASFEPASESASAEIADTKGVIPYTKYPISTSDVWDATAEVRDADTSDLKKMCTWFDSEKPELKSSYKLPHHTLSGYKTSWRGVATAMAALMGARGGVSVPESDRQGIYNHLSKHYKDFDKEPPELKTANEIIDKHIENRSAEEKIIDVIKLVNTFIEDFRAENEARKEIAKLNTEAFAKDIKKRFEDIELNIQGLQEGFQPGDTGLEQRLLNVEASVEQIAKDIREYLTSQPKGKGVEGREPRTAAPEKSKETRRLALKVLNKATELMNRTEGE